MNMVVFQNKIIYMPYMPPFARRERIEDYRTECGPVKRREERIDSLDGTRISLIVGELPHAGPEIEDGREGKILVLYFQG